MFFSVFIASYAPRPDADILPHSPSRRNPVNCQMIVTEMYVHFVCGLYQRRSGPLGKRALPSEAAGVPLPRGGGRAGARPSRGSGREATANATGETPVVPVGGCCSWLRAENPTAFLGRTFVMETILLTQTSQVISHSFIRNPRTRCKLRNCHARIIPDKMQQCGFSVSFSVSLHGSFLGCLW